LATNKPILVTGSHRSGTTWIGRVLAHSSSIGYLHEPFNKVYKNSGYGIKPAYWFQYISKANGHQYKKALDNLLKFRLLSFKALANYKPFNVKIFLKKNYQLFNHRLHHRRPLFKDPIALFAIQWLVEEYGCCPVILIRHPAAFVHSIKKQQWHFEFSEIHQQENLINDLLQPYKNEVSDFARNDYPLIDQAILLWTLTHHVIKQYQTEQANNWFFLRHEDIAQAPFHYFEKLYAYLNIPFREKEKKHIQQFSTVDTGNSHTDANPVNQIQRNSQETSEQWKNELSQAEIDHIYSKTHQLAGFFYPEGF